MSKQLARLLINRRLFTVLLLGFSSGLPLALIGSTLQAWFTEAHIDLVTIGMLSLLGLPYTLKFLWAPIMDHYGFSKISKHKGWILLTQASLVVTLLVLANMNPSSQASVMGLVALLIAFFSASQDISITAYQTDMLPTTERGLGAACYMTGYRVAMLIAGGLALISADYLGWRFTYHFMAGLMLLSFLLAWRAPAVVDEPRATKHVWQTAAASIKDLWQRENILWVLLFVFFYKFGDALALSLMTNFLLNGLSFTLTEVGLAYKVLSFIATILGGFVGGIILTRWNIYRALLLFGLAQAISNLTFAILAIVGKNFFVMTSSIFIETFCSGLSSAALVAFLMSLCHHRYTASQYALLSAIASIGRVFLGPVAGVMVENLGWIQFYIWSFVLCFPGLLLVFFLKNKREYYANAVVE